MTTARLFDYLLIITRNRVEPNRTNNSWKIHSQRIKLIPKQYGKVTTYYLLFRRLLLTIYLLFSKYYLLLQSINTKVYEKL